MLNSVDKEKLTFTVIGEKSLRAESPGKDDWYHRFFNKKKEDICHLPLVHRKWDRPDTCYFSHPSHQERDVTCHTGCPIKLNFG